MARQPSSEPIDEQVQSVPLDTSEGKVVIGQENTGADNMAGGGEFPDPDAPSQEPAPGSAPVSEEEVVDAVQKTRRGQPPEPDASDPPDDPGA